MVARADIADLIGSSYLNIDLATTNIYSSTKVNPTVTDGSNSLAYDYYILNQDANKKPVIVESSTYFDKKIKSTICKRDATGFFVSLGGYEGFDLEKGKVYELKITNKNV